MAAFVFDDAIFKSKFIIADGFRNRSKGIAGCDSVCPSNTDGGNKFKGYTSEELLSDTLHNVLGESLTDKKVESINDQLMGKILEDVIIKDKQLKEVFCDVMQNFYFNNDTFASGNSLSLLRYKIPSTKKDFGKFVYDVLFNEETRKRMSDVLRKDISPLDDIVSSAYTKLDILKKLKNEQEYGCLFSEELKDLYDIMNQDFLAALGEGADSVHELEFLLTYYLFIYMSQIAAKIDLSLENDCSSVPFPLFKIYKESVAEDRDCVSQGWKKVERKTYKIFKHLIVLNMLNCHDNSTKYYTYTDLFNMYENNPEERLALDSATDYIIQQYTKEHTYETDVSGQPVIFEPFTPNTENIVDNFRKKVHYIYDCVSLQLDSKKSRQDVVGYVASNYCHILKMRFVKPAGPLGNMLVISKEDLILFIKICQRTTTKITKERGIQIGDLFEEFRRRGLCFDAKTTKYITDYLIDINLIDSKCDSEEAQYVKRIQ